VITDSHLCVLGRTTLCVILAAVAWCDLANADDARPNIVYILSDDAGYNEFGFTAALNGTTTEFETPNLDALAAQSLIFSQGYAEPVCSPTRAALLTGQYPQRFGYETNIDAGLSSTQGLRGDQQTIGDYLKGLGYTIGVVGKWHVGSLDGVNRPQDQGFDEFYGMLDGGRPYWPNTGLAAEKHIRRGDVDIDSTWATEGDASRYDPTSGRYLTDAFGEEAADFVNRHAGDAEPFFLYMPLTGVHSPDQAKQSDQDHFAGISDPSLITRAAMAYAMDRSIGDVMQALQDNGIDENTIIVFANDNGGQGSHDNTPFQGRKGYIFEGGIRVPALIRAPGVDPGVFEAPITLRDFVPTLVNAAGGDANQIDVDAIDLMPHLNTDTTQVHDILFHRTATGAWAVRKGDWKLTSAAGEWFGSYKLFNPRTDPGETTDLQQQEPELVDELLKELAKWEATLEKAKWGSSGAASNTFDHFVLDTDTTSQTIYWTQSSRWKNTSGDVVTMRRDDAYANAIFEFPVRDSASYNTVNSGGRLTRQAAMLNQLRFTGSFGGSVSLSGSISGEPLLLVNNLDGESPKIMIDATSQAGNVSFSFVVNSQLQLLHDLEITGNGTQPLSILGGIVDFDEPRGVTKTGTSSVSLAGNNAFGGPLTVLGGRVAVANLAGDLINDDGVVLPGTSIGTLTVGGDFHQYAGTLEIELGSTGYDVLAIAGNATLGGTLAAILVDGFMPVFGQKFEFLTAAGIQGGFDSYLLPPLGGGLNWSLQNTGQSVSLIVGLPGDYNGDGAVDAADYTVWRNTLGQSGVGLAADGSGPAGVPDGTVDEWDYNFWKANYGLAALPITATAVPEPHSIALALLATCLILSHSGRKTELAGSPTPS